MRGLFEGRFVRGRWGPKPAPPAPADPLDLGGAVERASGRAVLEAVRRHGTEAQRARWAPVLEADPRRGAYAVTEAEAGSDASATRTSISGGRATGRKRLVSNGGGADVLLVLGRGDDGRLAAALVERGRGVSAAPVRGAGLEGLDLADVSLDGAPADPLGGAGEGFAVLETAMRRGRADLAAAAASAGAALLEAARASARGRVRFGRPLAEHEAVADSLDEAACDVRVLRAVAADAADRVEALDGRLEAAAAKAWSAATLARLADAALEVGGGAAWRAGSAEARAVVDARGLRLAFGADEVLAAYVALAGVEGVRAYLRETDAAMRSLLGFVRLLPLYALRRARLVFGRPRWTEAPAALAEPVALVEEAAGILAYRAFDLAFRRPTLLPRSGRLQQGLGRIAIEVYAAAAAVCAARAEEESEAWKVAARAHDRVARESRDLETAIVAAEDDDGVD